MYKYKPLRKRPPKIRLVTIEDSESLNAPLRLRLGHVDLDSRPRYLALSYTWDSPGPGFSATWGDGSTKTIQINGQDFRVRLNLYSALEALRSSTKLKEKLWIDAICVDQSSIEERNHQVHLIKEIYSRTVSTIAWLGPSDDQTETTFRKIKNISSLWTNGLRGLR